MLGEGDGGALGDVGVDGQGFGGHRACAEEGHAEGHGQQHQCDKFVHP